MFTWNCSVVFWGALSLTISCDLVVRDWIIFSLPFASDWLWTYMQSMYIRTYLLYSIAYYKVFFLFWPGAFAVDVNLNCSSIFFPDAICSLLLNDIFTPDLIMHGPLQVKRSFFNVAFMWGKHPCKPGLSLLSTFCSFATRDCASCQWASDTRKMKCFANRIMEICEYINNFVYKLGYGMVWYGI